MTTSPKRGQRPGTMHLDKRADGLLAASAAEGPDDQMLDTERVAAWLEVSVQFLEIARGRGTGPRFTRLSPRLVKYRRGDVRAWLRKRSHASTKEYAR